MVKKRITYNQTHTQYGVRDLLLDTHTVWSEGSTTGHTHSMEGGIYYWTHAQYGGRDLLLDVHDVD